MIGLSFGEIFVIGGISCLIMKPEEISDVVKKVSIFFSEARAALSNKTSYIMTSIKIEGHDLEVKNNYKDMIDKFEENAIFEIDDLYETSVDREFLQNEDTDIDCSIDAKTDKLFEKNNLTYIEKKPSNSQFNLFDDDFLSSEDDSEEDDFFGDLNVSVYKKKS